MAHCLDLAMPLTFQENLHSRWKEVSWTLAKAWSSVLDGVSKDNVGSQDLFMYILKLESHWTLFIYNSYTHTSLVFC